jgi:hypothetical protein
LDECHAGIVRAVAERHGAKLAGIAVETGSFGQERTHIIPGTIAQDQRCAVVAHKSKVPAIARHQQVRPGS